MSKTLRVLSVLAVLSAAACSNPELPDLPENEEDEDRDSTPKGAMRVTSSDAPPAGLPGFLSFDRR